MGSNHRLEGSRSGLMHNRETASPLELAEAYAGEQRALNTHKADGERALRRKYSDLVRQSPVEFVLNFARSLLFTFGYRWQAYEIIAGHTQAFKSLDVDTLEELGQGINSWWTVDAFARTLSGPAWRDGLVQDELIIRWAGSPDFWWRRAALVSTVAFNLRSLGGKGDTRRTMAICELLAADHEDMVVKAMSWALRQLVDFDPTAVEGFIRKHEHHLAGRVKREVGNKLKTGLKNPRGKRSG